MKTENLCTKRGRGGTLLASVALLLGLGFSQNVFAVQASGSILESPNDTSLQTGQIVTVDLFIVNTSSETPPEGTVANPVPATVKATAEVRVRMACDSVLNCPALALPGTLTFVPGPQAGCFVKAAEVATCVLDPADPTNNTILITMAAPLALPPAAVPIPFATVQMQAATPIFNPVSGAFQQQAGSGTTDLTASSIVNPALSPANGGFQGGTSFLYPGTCDVEIDKQVSCDGGVTWVDVTTADDPNPRGVQGCEAADPDTILVRFKATNTGDQVLSDCTVGDPNFPGDVTDITLDPGADTGFIDRSGICSQKELGEPNTATVSCKVCANIEQEEPITDSDTATFQCATPDVKVDRQVSCDNTFPGSDPGLEDQNEDDTNGCTAPDGTSINWRYQACNVGPTALKDCRFKENNGLVNSTTPFAIVNADLGGSDDLAKAGDLGDCTELLPNGEGPVACNQALEDSENPDLGRLDLECCTQPRDGTGACPEGTAVTAYDVSTVDCLNADVNLDKTCIDADENGEFEVALTTTNTGEGSLDCTVGDTIYLDDPSCPNTGIDGQPVTVAPANFTLASQAQQVSTGVYTLTADACNTAVVNCTDALGNAQSDTADATCDIPNDLCLTRTPGFWGTHPAVTQRFLDIEVCGRTLDSVNAETAQPKNAPKTDSDSTTEAMCSVGTDGKILGPQQTQLIRQCTAAVLNVTASADPGTFEDPGDCLSAYPGIGETLASCCGYGDEVETSICQGGTVGEWTTTDCIEALDMFNNWDQDTLNFPFKTGPADSSQCRAAKGNNYVVGPSL